jgi:hypothetical protein
MRLNHWYRIKIINSNKLICLFLVSILAISCSKKDKDVKLEIIPERPVVIDSPLTYVDPITGAKKVYNPPWYTFTVKITNGSSQKITYVTLKATVTTGDDNDFKTTEYKFDPGSNNGTSWYYGVVNPGETYKTSGWIIGDLPKSDSFSYGVSLEATGWYGDYNAPEKRLSLTTFHSTQ